MRPLRIAIETPRKFMGELALPGDGGGVDDDENRTERRTFKA
jgi:hypothetical protein